MPRDPERAERLQGGLRKAKLDAVACSLPANVLLLTGYWPVVGTSVALTAWDGQTALIAPEDEMELTEAGGADRIWGFHAGSLDRLTDAEEAVLQPLTEAFQSLRLDRGRVGYDGGPTFEPASYAAMHLFGDGLKRLLQRAAPGVTLVPAGEFLEGEQAVLTTQEAAKVRLACQVAGRAFEEGRRHVRARIPEVDLAALFRTLLSTAGTGRDGIRRADGYTSCMSGPNSFKAHGAYAHSTDRELSHGDLVLVHCNSYADGFWTDVTRTYCLGPLDDRKRAIYEAVFAARAAALQAIRPGATGADVDRAAREVLRQRGFGDAFKHGTGHGVGFHAIGHTVRPRLHPKSDDVLRPGMVFNVEPAVYLEGFGGVRHCDMVYLTDSGPEVLTPFHGSIEQLQLT